MNKFIRGDYVIILDGRVGAALGQILKPALTREGAWWYLVKLAVGLDTWVPENLLTEYRHESKAMDR